ncbi:MAG TPA: YeiH family protein [Magnetospirillaceae bacterium]|jgi:uncharacterized integral membrane protein (TIGR00698 family)
MPPIDNSAVLAPVAPAIQWHQRWGWMPGLLLSLALAAAAMGLHDLRWFHDISAAAMAILIGIGLRRVVTLSPALQPGLAIATRTLLRTAVILLGLQVTFGQIAALGVQTIGIVIASLVTCFFATEFLGRRLGVEAKLARLIATGTSICGASAIVAANSVTRGRDEDVAYALAIVTAFGTVAMFAMPALVPLFGFAPTQAGIWLGASIHEVAQVVGAATTINDQTVTIATIAKMARIVSLAPIVLLMATAARRSMRSQAGNQADKQGNAVHARVPVPWFVFGFLFLAGAASFGVVPPIVTHDAGLVASFLLAAALGAMGFGIDLGALRRMGLRPLVLAASSWLILAGVSFALLRIAG